MVTVVYLERSRPSVVFSGGEQSHWVNSEIDPEIDQEAKLGENHWSSLFEWTLLWINTSSGIRLLKICH